MKRFALRSVLIFIFIHVARVSSVAQVLLSGPESDAKPDTEMFAEQYLLVGTATRGCGESQVAVNPLNSNQIAVFAMCQLNQQKGKFERQVYRTGAACQITATFSPAWTWMMTLYT